MTQRHTAKGRDDFMDLRNRWQFCKMTSSCEKAVKTRLSRMRGREHCVSFLSSCKINTSMMRGCCFNWFSAAEFHSYYIHRYSYHDMFLWECHNILVEVTSGGNCCCTIKSTLTRLDSSLQVYNSLKTFHQKPTKFSQFCYCVQIHGSDWTRDLKEKASNCSKMSQGGGGRLERGYEPVVGVRAFFTKDQTEGVTAAKSDAVFFPHSARRFSLSPLQRNDCCVCPCYGDRLSMQRRKSALQFELRLSRKWNETWKNWEKLERWFIHTWLSSKWKMAVSHTMCCKRTHEWLYRTSLPSLDVYLTNVVVHVYTWCAIQN